MGIDAVQYSATHKPFLPLTRAACKCVTPIARNVRAGGLLILMLEG